MNGYICFYNGTKLEVHAAGLYEAKRKAVAELNIRKSHEHKLAVVLAEIGVGPTAVQVTHSTASL